MNVMVLEGKSALTQYITETKQTDDPSRLQVEFSVEGEHFCCLGETFKTHSASAR